MARLWLKPDGHSSNEVWTAWGRALIRLVQFYRDDHLWNQALTAAREFADARHDGWPIAFVPAQRQGEVAEFLIDFSDYPRAARVLQGLESDICQLLKSYDSKANGSEPVDMSGLGRICLLLGDCRRLSGQLEEAREYFRLSLALAELMLKTFGESHTLLRDLSASLECVGNIELNHGDIESALLHYRKSLQLAKRIVSKFGESQMSLHDIYVSLAKVGDVECERGHLKAAMVHYRECLQLAERFVVEFGESPVNLRAVSVSLTLVGDVELKTGERDAALNHYRESLQLRERIASEFGETPESLRDLYVALSKVGDVEYQAGKRSAALARFRKSLELAERIVLEFGENPRSLSDVVFSEINIISIKESEDRSAAIRRLKRARELTKQIITRGWGTRDNDQDLQWIERKLAKLNGPDK